MDGDSSDVLREIYPRGQYLIIRAALTHEEFEEVNNIAIFTDTDVSSVIRAALKALREKRATRKETSDDLELE